MSVRTVHSCLQVLERIKDPLMTLLSRDHFETAYAVLCHFHLIAQRAPIIFSQVQQSQAPLYSCRAHIQPFAHLQKLLFGVFSCPC